jgi:hypothetical protein
VLRFTAGSRFRYLKNMKKQKEEMEEKKREEEK